jgi:putative holliday junction resolvase
VRAAGIDYGKARVGLAVSDELGLLAHPRPFLDGRNLKQVLRTLTQLAAAEQLQCFVVGLPRQLNGREGTSARRARHFADLLREASGIEVELVDEWLSTKEAMGRLRDGGATERSARERVDGAAAAILLQSWLDQQRGRGASGGASVESTAPSAEIAEVRRRRE